MIMLTQAPVTRTTTGLVALFTVASLFTSTSSHPQCFDFRPPFQVSSSSGFFCSEYSDFGCCSDRNDSLVAMRYHEIQAQLGPDIGLKCSNYIKEILCQECSPYALHIYDGESTQQIRPFPGLCQPYCHEFYRACEEVIQYITQEEDILKTLYSADVFCSHIAPPDYDYCYPELKANPSLSADLQEVENVDENNPSCMCLETFATEIRNPVILRSPNDDTGRIFVAEQIGVVYIYYKNGTKLPTPFLNISETVVTSEWRGDERGFLGLTFHPDYRFNKKMFIYYTIRNSEGQLYIRISELIEDGYNQNIADVSSERVIIEIYEPYWNHNGGELLFGTDGYLYIFVGDGGNGGDPDGYSQNLESLLGKVLRIDVNNLEDGKEYSIPADNPFINDALARPEIYAYGIRNIWRCGMDTGDLETGYGKGRIFCGDVGQSSWEEIDIIEHGGNYGWNAREGFECFDQKLCGNIDSEVLPIHAYSHDEGKAVVGGHVYRGCLNPGLTGQYFFADYVEGKIWRLFEDLPTSTWQSSQVSMCGPDVCMNGLHSSHKRNILSFGEDYDGEVYVLATSNPSPMVPEGEIYRLVDPRRRGDISECRSQFTKDQNERLTTTPPPTTTSRTTHTPVIDDWLYNSTAKRRPCIYYLILTSFIMVMVVFQS